MKDYYKILEVHRESSITKIKLSFRELIKKYHPDANLNSNNFTEIMQDINEAYDTLKDNSKRNAYNLMYDKHYKNDKKREQSQAKKQEPKNFDEYLWNGLNTKKYKAYSSDEFEVFKNRVISSFKKSEFETTIEFEKRIKEIESELLNSYLGNQDITMKYNADNSSFLVTIDEGLTCKISVPRDIAPNFKSSIKNFIVRCSKDLKIIDINTEFRGVKYIGNAFKKDWVLSREKKIIEKIERENKVIENAPIYTFIIFGIIFFILLLSSLYFS